MTKDQPDLDFNGLFANPDFHKLEQSLKRFNVFEATEIRDMEIKHTRFLKYLLDPNESHGLGESFLQNFLWLATLSMEDFPDLHKLDLLYAYVKAERMVRSPDKSRKRPVDLFLKIPSSVPDFRNIGVVVENKINSKEGSDQLKDYREWLAVEYPDKTETKLFHLFLTKRGEEANETEKEYWFPITYAEQVVPAIQYTLDQHAGKISPHIEQVLKDYRDLVSDEDDSGERDDLTRRICENHLWVNSSVNRSRIVGSRAYVRHKVALDVLMKYVDDKRYALAKLFKQMAENPEGMPCKHNLDDYVVLPGYAMRPRFSFAILKSNLVRAARDMVQDKGDGGIDSKSPICFKVEFYKDEGKKEYSCRIKLILGPMIDPELRKDLLKRLLEEFAGDKVNRRVSAVNWTTINASDLYIDVDDPKDWFEKNCFSPISGSSLELSPLVEDWVLKSNAAFQSFIDAL